jgi:hypothetical protein
MISAGPSNRAAWIDAEICAASFSAGMMMEIRIGEE